MAAAKTPLYVVLGAVALYCVSSALAIPAKGQEQPGAPPFVSLNSRNGDKIYRVQDFENNVVCYVIPALRVGEPASISCVAVPGLRAPGPWGRDG